MSLNIFLRASVAISFLGLGACTGSTDAKSPSGSVSSSSAKTSQFHLSLTDAPNDNLTAVMVRIKHVEIRVSGRGREARLITGENLGTINLLDLQNGVTLPLADLALPAGIQINQIRLVLEEGGHYILRNNETRCDLKTPSAEKTGIKILIHRGMTVSEGYSYSMVVDFDAKESIVQLGNGDCLLKPVLKIKSATCVHGHHGRDHEDGDSHDDDESDSADDDSDSQEHSTLPADGSSQVGDESGYDNGTDESVPVVPPAVLNDFIVGTL